MKPIAIIPARGGSKRIPGKNIRPFAGRPLIAHPIEAARRSGLFSRIVISTDSEEIAGIARQYGAEVPFMRPAALAGDFTPTMPVVLHALDELEREGGLPEFVCRIYPTTPLISAEDLARGFQMLTQSGGDAVLAICAYSYPIQRALELDPSGFVRMINPQHRLTRSQDLPTTYHDAGQFYWYRVSALRATGGSIENIERTLPLVIPAFRVQDIDTPEDWSIAEEKFRLLEQMGGKKQVG